MTLPGFPPAGDDRRRSAAAPPSPPASTSTTGRGTRLVDATRTFTRNTAKRIDDVSRADGADKSGLRTLIWSNCLSMGADALVSVYLAATLFFAAPGEQQRGNVALYLLVTVAPFAVIAPVIGPLLDRIDRGRRVALAATFGLRAVLCYLLAVHTGSTVLLYICALLLLVFSRAYTVLRAAVVPRVLPEGMPLVTANSRMNVFGMVGAGILGAVGAGIIKLFNSLEPIEQSTTPGAVAAPTLGFTIELIVSALVFLAGGWVSLRLPQHVDTDEGEGKVSMSSRRAEGRSAVRLMLGTHVVTALRSSSVQKFLGGFLSFFLVFYIQATMQGFGALATLGVLGAAAGVGSVAGTSIGTRFAGHSPDNVVLVASGIAVGCCILAAITPGIAISIIVALIAAVASALGKIALDAIIQREIPDAYRSSAFSRSETVLQLAWVAGGTLGILLPTTAGTFWIGWTVSAVILTVAFGLILYGRQRAQQEGPRKPGLAPREPSGRRISAALPARLRR
ncbi:MFS transporter, partial [Cumulibacter manganitolerans]|uniref:MFS transporter n=1 Tax=Cumulibacter manganitolerans TaxID=1884992 RepID=UPI001885E5F6